jgi:prefoldin subunit 5
MMKKKETRLRQLIDDLDQEIDELENCLRSVRNATHTSFMLGAEDNFCIHMDQTVEILAKRISELSQKRTEAHRELETAFYTRIQSGQKV